MRELQGIAPGKSGSEMHIHLPGMTGPSHSGLHDHLVPLQTLAPASRPYEGGARSHCAGGRSAECNLRRLPLSLAYHAAVWMVHGPACPRTPFMAICARKRGAGPQAALAWQRH